MDDITLIQHRTECDSTRILECNDSVNSQISSPFKGYVVEVSAMWPAV
jgi:hypothetical protein